MYSSNYRIKSENVFFKNSRQQIIFCYNKLEHYYAVAKYYLVEHEMYPLRRN